MTVRFDQEVLEERSRNLGTLNGIELVLVDLTPAAAPIQAWLTVEFFNANSLVAIENDINTSGSPPTDIFTIRGGSRLPGGKNPGEVRVVQVVAGTGNTLRLRVEPIGDYSTYTLHVREVDGTNTPIIDPLFSSIEFKFRPGCFNLNCAPEWDDGQPPCERPPIDYLSKDFDSFKHLLINAMSRRVPEWQPTSEADLDQVLIDLLAADADELSDFQDRVMAEAYIASARKRVSLARHARLMDYHVHQGQQAGTWLMVSVSSDLVLPARFGVWTGAEGELWSHADAVIFPNTEDRQLLAAVNELQLYTWGGTVMSIDAGATAADLTSSTPLLTKSAADALRDLLRSTDVPHLVVEEKLNPETGTENGRDTTKRQLLQLVEGDSAAESVFDPVESRWMVRVRWREEDVLQERYCFTTRCNGSLIGGVSTFHGNVVRATHGRPHETTFKPDGGDLDPTVSKDLIFTDETYYETSKWGVTCALPHRPLGYRTRPTGGEFWEPSTLAVRVKVDGAVSEWLEQSDLIESEADQEHFVVETDEEGWSRVRFGNNANGRAVPDGAVVECAYQVGRGSEGNVGLDTLIRFDPAAVSGVTAVNNPFDVEDGLDPEPVREIVRRVPEAYRQRQLRAVTLEDYAERAAELEGVSAAHAGYAWTGSWRTVRVAIDPVGTTVLSDELRSEIHAYLDAVRLIGDDLEVRGARYVPLDVELHVCAGSDYWIEDLAAELEMEFSNAHTASGRRGFFHPDAWTFGQPLHASQVIGRALEVPGVERVTLLSIRRFDAEFGPTTSSIVINPSDRPAAEIDVLAVEPHEVIQVANDVDHLETGRIAFHIEGGRR